MSILTSYPPHRRDCANKQRERTERISSLPSQYKAPLTRIEREILDKPIEDLVRDVHNRAFRPIDILRSFGKAAISAHQKTNCLTEVLLSDAEEWTRSQINLNGPLAGIPVSLKDSIVVGGYDATVGYSSRAFNPYKEDGAIVRLLKDAGAVPHVKTNIPITLLSFESANDVWGRTLNPHNTEFSPGGSTGGEAALIALGGSRIGIGSDVAGSVRVPAHFSGIYALRSSTGRWPKSGMSTSMPGQEGVPSVFSPMTKTLPDMAYFYKSILSMKPWEYDHSVHPIPWRDELYRSIQASPSLRIGVLESDGVVPPSPACARALTLTTAALAAQGHTIIPADPPSPLEGLRLASMLLNSDGCTTFRSSFRAFEPSDPGAAQLSFYASLPRSVKYLYYLYVRYLRRDPVWASLLRDFGPKSSAQLWELVAQREKYRAEWHSWWKNAALDILLTVPNATPAVPHGGMSQAVSSCGYTFLFNLIDYTAGVLPVTHVDREKDSLPPGFSIKQLNGVARGAYSLYDADAMHGLPIGVQVVGQRLDEERVLAAMERVVEALADKGGPGAYQGLEIE
ncbi:MAG: hypothetical protein M1825_004054 [Sarcosagium campestre]|nr:MAG: hypothetical protein M1825_004054 [Sarcosagium campestre]